MSSDPPDDFLVIFELEVEFFHMFLLKPLKVFMFMNNKLSGLTLRVLLTNEYSKSV